MKRSPRDHLLARHAAAIPALDSARRDALAETLRDITPVPMSQLLPALFRPQRHLWTAFAATWILLAALHLSQRSASPDSTTLQAEAPVRTELAARDSFFNRQAQLHALLR